MKRELRKVKKTCKFPNCCETFVAYPQTKYCPEHRNTKYRKHLLKTAKKTYPDDNFKLLHEFKTAQVMRRKCAHENCNNEYDVTIYPGQFIYCNYCETHRNPYKRRNIEMS